MEMVGGKFYVNSDFVFLDVELVVVVVEIVWFYLWFVGELKWVFFGVKEVVDEVF